MMRLLRADVELLDAAIAGDDALAQALGHDVAPGWVTFTVALESIRAAPAETARDPRRGTRLFVAESPAELVGWGGFKGPPSQGIVEIGYEIAERRRERGLATAAVTAMLTEAFADDRVSAVVAHTLPERNASNRVLEKAGFAFDGEAMEGENRVWRFTRTRHRDAG